MILKRSVSERVQINFRKTSFWLLDLLTFSLSKSDSCFQNTQNCLPYIIIKIVLVNLFL